MNPIALEKLENRLNRILTITNEKGCKLVIGGNHKYARININKKMYYLHRLRIALRDNIDYEDTLWESKHSCDITNCIELTHLSSGTHTENVRETVARKRQFNMSKTHCPQGHPYSKINTYNYFNHRLCRKCRRENNKEQRYIRNFKKRQKEKP